MESVALPNLSYVPCDDLSSEHLRQLTATLSPWLGVAINAPGLTTPLLAAPRLGTITIRKSLVAPGHSPPSGPGRAAKGGDRSGVLIHWLGGERDPDLPVGRLPLASGRYSTPEGLSAELDLLGSRALVEALRHLDSSTPEVELRSQAPVLLRIDRSGPSTPRDLPRAARLRRPRDPRLANRLRELVKASFFLAWLSTAVPLRNLVRGWSGRCHVTVLLFHRVSDSYDDSVTVGVEQFRDILRLLKRRYDILDLPEFLANRGLPRRRPAVVLTFDDGYEDNFLAAVLLRREGIPCTFFISTRIVGNGTAFPHDLKNLGHRVPPLSWDQVRRMAAWGFHFGNHTANHINLAEVPVDEAVEEVRQAIGDLRRELGDDAPGLHWLAYPYGRAGDMTAEVRGRLPGLGVSHCFSAYGGSNATDFDVFDVRRQNIDATFGAIRLLAAVEGWGVRVPPRVGDSPGGTLVSLETRRPLPRGEGLDALGVGR
jgi:peptidoglycan/xylan/chitin deacetylase (PgdA/CDA1 family)